LYREREEKRMGGLLEDSGLEDVIANASEGENGCGESVASRQRATAEEVRKEFVVVFYARGKVSKYF
jgi:hypothetical protein